MGGGPDKSNLSFASTYVLSAAASCIAETATYPFDIPRPGSKSPANVGTRFGEALSGQWWGSSGRKDWCSFTEAWLQHVYDTWYTAERALPRTKCCARTYFKKNADGSFSLHKGMAAGMLAGGFGQFIATPTDLVKVQMQIEGKRLARGEPPRYPGASPMRSEAYTKLVGSEGCTLAGDPPSNEPCSCKWAT